MTLQKLSPSCTGPAHFCFCPCTASKPLIACTMFWINMLLSCTSRECIALHYESVCVFVCQYIGLLLDSLPYIYFFASSNPRLMLVGCKSCLVLLCKTSQNICPQSNAWCVLLPFNTAPHSRLSYFAERSHYYLCIEAALQQVHPISKHKLRICMQAWYLSQAQDMTHVCSLAACIIKFQGFWEIWGC